MAECLSHPSEAESAQKDLLHAEKGYSQRQEHEQEGARCYVDEVRYEAHRLAEYRQGTRNSFR